MARKMAFGTRSFILVGLAVLFVAILLTGVSVRLLWINDLYQEQIKRDSLITKVSNAMICPIKQTDSRLVDYVKKHVLFPPSGGGYHLEKPRQEEHSIKNVELITKLFNHKKGGIFVEGGAFDGEYLSSTLMLEQEYDWTGLLIEPHKDTFHRLKTKNRKAWLSNVCLSTEPSPQIVMFEDYGQESKSDVQYDYVTVNCVPLYTLLLATNLTGVDYMTLHVEGVELSVLKTLPFETLNIKVLLIENPKYPLGDKFLLSFMKEKGYYLTDDIDKEPGYGRGLPQSDLIFVKETFLTKSEAKERLLKVLD